MKTTLKIVAILLILAGSFSCEKENDIDMSKIDFSNIENLYEQPLPVIQKAIQGKWKLVYAKGGFVANYEYYFDNSFVEFTSDNRYISTNAIRQDTALYAWQKEINIYSPNDYVFIMTPFNYFFDKIHNDTLVYAEYAVDGMTYNCIKTNH
ncbi:hypothetical protein FACS18947_2130 [Bacteroidia bacterium]|nr:hypothetical protein FACS18947_2130 [Bacteroidia bacterium]